MPSTVAAQKKPTAGSRDNPWSLKTPPGSSEFQARPAVLPDTSNDRAFFRPAETWEISHVGGDRFAAKSRDEEMKATDLELNVLMSIEDVTDRVNKAVAERTSPRLRGRAVGGASGT